MQNIHSFTFRVCEKYLSASLTKVKLPNQGKALRVVYAQVCGFAAPTCTCVTTSTGRADFEDSLMILPQVHLRKPCYDFYFL